MKKILLFAAAAMIAFAACDKPTPGPTPGPSDEVCDDCGKNPCECPPASSDTELFLTYDLKFQLGVQTNYAGVTASLEGDKILKFFDMTEEELTASLFLTILSFSVTHIRMLASGYMTSLLLHHLTSVTG